MRDEINLQRQEESLLPSILKATLIHVLILLALVWVWPQTISDEVHVPNYVKATLLTMQPSQAPPPKATVATNSKPAVTTRPEVKTATVKTPAPETVNTTIAKPKVDTTVDKLATTVNKVETQTTQVAKVEVKPTTTVDVKPVEPLVTPTIVVNETKVEQQTPTDDPEVQSSDVDSEVSTPETVVPEEQKPVVDESFDLFAELELESQLEAERQARETAAIAAAKAQEEQEAQLAAQRAAQDAEDQQAIGNYKDQIAIEIERQWSRPPTARPDLEVVLTIRLLPTGELNDVKIIQSSGDSAFDRSAEVAVKKVRSFPVPKNISLFEKGGFREFNLKFRPEDLQK